MRCFFQLILLDRTKTWKFDIPQNKSTDRPQGAEHIYIQLSSFQSLLSVILSEGVYRRPKNLYIQLPFPVILSGLVPEESPLSLTLLWASRGGERMGLDLWVLGMLVIKTQPNWRDGNKNWQILEINFVKGVEMPIWIGYNYKRKMRNRLEWHSSLYIFFYTP